MTNKNGMNWIRPEKRLALYLRDGMACCYCGVGVETGIQLTLDHLQPREHGGSNAPTNLITACVHCNSARGQRSWKKFAERAGGRRYTHAIRRIELLRHRAFDVEFAKQLIAARGFTAAVYRAPKAVMSIATSRRAA